MARRRNCRQRQQGSQRRPRQRQEGQGEAHYALDMRSSCGRIVVTATLPHALAELPEDGLSVLVHIGGHAQVFEGFFAARPPVAGEVERGMRIEQR